MKKFLPASLLFLFCSNFINAQSGLLDPSFGNNGIVKTDMGFGFNYDNAGKQILLQSDGSMYLVIEAAGVSLITKKHSDGTLDLTYGEKGFSESTPIYGSHAALQADGKIVIAGYTLNSDQYFNIKDFAVARFNTDGTLDKTFAGDGIQVTDFGYDDVANSLAIQGDGKIILAGYIDNTTSYEHLMDFAVARYNTDGSLDDTFNGSGTVTSDFGYDEEYANSVALQSDGKIVVGGFALVRYDTDGNIDDGFGSGGLQFVDFGPGGMSNAISIQSDDKIIAAGYTLAGANSDFEVARFNSDGTPDNTFDGDGLQTVDFGGANDRASSIAIQSNGKIILAGYTDGSGNNFAIARLTTNGALDNSYSGDARLTTDFGSSDDYINSLAIQSDGKLVALGYAVNTTGSFFIAVSRYNTNGTPDNTFDGDGVLIDHVAWGNTNYTSSAIQSDKKIVVVGYTWNGTDNDFSLVRYNTDGSLDNTFSGDGKQTIDFGSTDDRANAIVIQGDGTIVVGGSAGSNFVIARYNSDGTLDDTFSGNGFDVIDAGFGGIASLAIQTDGKILAGGAALVRYNTNGTLDVSFDGDGKITTPFDTDFAFDCNDIAIQNDGKIVIIGIADENTVVARYNTDGTPDDTFHGDGMRFISDEEESFVFLNGNSIAVQSDGKIVIGGGLVHDYRGTRSSFFLLRLNADGSSDDTFNGGNMLLTSPGGNYDYGTSLLLQSDNKIILAGYSYNGSSDDFSITRFNTDGNLDNSFSDDGIEITQASSAYDRIASINISDDKLYAVGYGQYPANFGVVARYLLAAGGPTPVTFTDFRAVLQNKSVLLKWQTASEKNLSGFVIERSADGNNFSPIGNVSSIGNSNSRIDYSMLDKTALPGTNFYRLKLVDTDGKFKYSKIIAVNITADNFTYRIFPNPAKNILFIQANGDNEKALFQITDVTGRKLKEINTILNGNTSFSILINSLPRGMYNLQLHTKTRTETKRFIKD